MSMKLIVFSLLLLSVFDATFSGGDMYTDYLWDYSTESETPSSDTSLSSESSATETLASSCPSSSVAYKTIADKLTQAEKDVTKMEENSEKIKKIPISANDAEKKEKRRLKQKTIIMKNRLKDLLKEISIDRANFKPCDDKQAAELEERQKAIQDRIDAITT